MDMSELLQKLQDGEHEMYEKATEEDIAMTESAIGLALPPSYRALVSRFSNGAYLYTIQEDDPAAPHGRWRSGWSLRERSRDTRQRCCSPITPVPSCLGAIASPTGFRKGDSPGSFGRHTLPPVTRSS